MDVTGSIDFNEMCFLGLESAAFCTGFRMGHTSKGLMLGSLINLWSTKNTKTSASVRSLSSKSSVNSYVSNKCSASSRSTFLASFLGL